MTTLSLIMLSMMAPPAPDARTIELSGKTLHYLEAGPASAPAVLLLHGGRFSSKTWLELGTIDRLAEAGHRVVAVDLPGFGESEASPIPREAFLLELMKAMELDEAVVVSPSMSGAFSLPLLASAPERVRGYVPVAPVAIGQYAPKLEGVDVPALIVWGDNDTVIPLSESETLQAALPASRRFVMRGARHPCYLDDPDAFHAELLAFLASLSR